MPEVKAPKAEPKQIEIPPMYVDFGRKFGEEMRKILKVHKQGETMGEIFFWNDEVRN